MHNEEANQSNQIPDEVAAHSSEVTAFGDSLKPTVETASANSTHDKRRRNKIILAAAACAALLVLTFWYFLRSQPATGTTSDAQVVVSVRTAKVERQPIALEVRALGTIFPREQATVSSNIGAQIIQMRQLKNQVVRAGEVIAVLQSRDLQAQRAEAVAALSTTRLQAQGVTSGSIPQASAQIERDLRDARASVANARALYERRQSLYKQGGIALRDVEAAQLSLTTAEDNLRLVERTAALRSSTINPNDQALAQSAVAQAQQRVAALDVQLSYATIRTPLTGIVTDQFQFAGEYAAPGARLVQVADISEVIVKANFADTVVAHLKIGDSVTVLPNDLPGERMGGKVSLISRSSDLLNRTVEVWVNLGNTAGRLRTGSAAEVVVAANNANDALVVPATAVTLDATNADAGTVMTVDAESIAHETKVRVGIRTPDVIQILEGVQAGDTVVTEGNYALPDGTKVEVNSAPAEGANGATGNQSSGDAATTQTQGAGGAR